MRCWSRRNGDGWKAGAGRGDSGEGKGDGLRVGENGRILLVLGARAAVETVIVRESGSGSEDL
jgi:hypothetical protein